MHQNRSHHDPQRPADAGTGRPGNPGEARSAGESRPDGERASSQMQQGARREKQPGGGKPSTQHGGAASPDSRQPSQHDTTREQYGEGNYAASRRYDEGAKRFAESGKADAAARAAAPRDQDEARELREAEAAGKRRMKEEDPALNRDATPKPGHGPDA